MAKPKLPEGFFSDSGISFKEKIIGIFSDIAQSLRRVKDIKLEAPNVNIEAPETWSEIRMTPERDSKGIATYYTIRKVK